MHTLLVTRFNGYPLYLFAALAPLAMGAAFLVNRFELTSRVQNSTLPRIVAIIGGVLAAVLALIVIFYLLSPAPIDNGEIEHVCTSYWFKTGHPLYHAADAGERYSVGYGPMAYIPFAAAMALLGPSYFACKLLSVICCGLFFFLTFRCLRTRADARTALLWCALVLALSVAHWFQTFYAKADPILYLCVITSLWAAIGPRRESQPATGARDSDRAFSIILIAFTLGIAINMKAHAALYFVYPLLLLVQRVGWQSTALAITGAAVIAIIPFFHPHISFTNWLYWLNQERRQGFGVSEFEWNIHWFLFLLLLLLGPFILARLNGGALLPRLAKSEKLPLAGLIFSLAAVALAASKAGSGPNHLVPFVPLLCFAAIPLWRQAAVEKVETPGRTAAMEESEFNAEKLADSPQSEGSKFKVQSPTLAAPKSDEGGFKARLAPLPPHLTSPALLTAYLATTLLLAIHAEIFMAALIVRGAPFCLDVNSEVKMIMAAFPGKSIAMGSGDTSNYQLSNCRLPLIFAGQPYVFDQTALMGHEAARIPFPPKTWEILSRQTIDVWLIPTGDRPFSLQNYYPPHRWVFGEHFFNLFLENYQLQARTRFFDIYMSKSRLPSAPAT
jgi:hypothetical protein